ncbi:transposase [Bradyrhizobium sp. Ai1a-2]|uniref:IS66 family transposase n=1 Tax=Bradyrhizobium sp. Ai1a-2 TaxID=196490 RepID=UPI0003F6CEBB|nr:transposase [Bradyrhizobium sp. Ai1a-2]
MLIAFSNADDPLSGNHESLKSKTPKRKKAKFNTQLSCKIEYFVETNSVYRSGGSAFFTKDLFLDDGRLEPDTNIVERSIRPIGIGRRCCAAMVISCYGRSCAMPTSTQHAMPNLLQGPNRTGTPSGLRS